MFSQYKSIAPLAPLLLYTNILNLTTQKHIIMYIYVYIYLICTPALKKISNILYACVYIVGVFS